MAPAIEVHNLRKSYRNVEALRGISFTVEEGEIYGFIGPNGAGKTTTIKILATLLRPTSGTAKVGGYDVQSQPDDVRRIMGYMPDYFGVYNDLKVWEYLDFYAAAYRIPPVRRAKVIDDLLELTDLGVKRDAFVNELSKGMKQRLCLARALVHNPSILVLDEPAAGLDPRARIELRDLLKELRNMGKTIFISSHILTELSDFCTSVGIIEAGKMMASGSIQQINQMLSSGVVLRVEVQGDAAQAAEVARAYPKVKEAEEIEPGAVEVHFEGTHDEIPDFTSYLVQKGVRIISIDEAINTLEDIFMKVTKGEVT